ncbi:MAG: SDR family oxidoreductase, partial [Kibdelosporangium sp.]
MADQFTPQDPRSQYPPPSQQTGHEQPHPGTESRMGPKPDHGEDTYRGCGRLTDRKAVLTGGDSGIGRAVAIAFAREGADVLLSYLPEEEADAQETAELVRQAGRQAELVPGDIRDEQHCDRIAARAVEVFGRIDILVNNAAYQMAQDEGLLDISTEQFDRVLKTNLYAMFWLCKAAIP